MRPLTAEFRNRCILLCFEVFRTHGIIVESWTDIWKRLAFLKGTPDIGRGPNVQAKVLDWLNVASDEDFLDFLEIIFKVEEGHYSSSMEDLIDGFNEFFRQDGLPYAITKYVWVEEVGHSRFGTGRTIRLAEFPRVVRADSEVAHAEAIGPVLTLLSDQRFAVPNSEFLRALEDHRKGDYEDCVAKCGSALESTLKVICEVKQWPYQQNDTVRVLLDTVMRQSKLEGFFAEPLAVIGTLRNRMSSAHGGGVVSRAVSIAKAQYALNATASAILLIVNHCIG